VANGGPSRWDAERAVKVSDLPAPSRLLVLTLLTRVSSGTLTIPVEYAPSLTTLSSETGLSRAGVTKHLNLLEVRGWLERQRPGTREALKRQARTGYRICPPVHLVDQSTSWTSPPHGLPHEESQVAAGPPDGLVHDVDGGSPRRGLNPKYGPKSSPTERTKGGTGGSSRRPKTDDEHPKFAEFYDRAYPLKKARGAARVAFNRAVAKVEDPQVLIDAAWRYRDDPQVKRGFIKHPSTWLNQECWSDDVAPAPGFAATGTDGVPGHGPRARVNDTDWSQGGPTL
jgi:hypothetical protein